MEDVLSNGRGRSRLHSRRAVAAGALVILAAPFVRRATAQQVPVSVPPYLAELYEKAKPEGEVSIWGPSGASLEWIPGEFNKRFPGVKVTWFGDNQASSRLITEARAGRHAADTWTFSLGGTLDVQKRGLLQKIDWKEYGAADRDIFFDGEAVTVHNSVFTPIFAKNRMSRDQVPARWVGLLEPAWTERLVAGTFLLPRLGGYLALDWGLDETERWTRALMDQRKMLVTTAPVAGFLATGERQLAPAETTVGAFLMQRDGLDAGYRVLDIAPVAQFIASVVKNAPHPNAARLLCAWLITPEAKMLYEKVAGLADVRSNPSSPLAQEIKAVGAKVIWENLEQLPERLEYFRKLTAVVRGQG